MSNATETETRPKHADILSMQSNHMRNCRFPLSSLSVEPEDTWCSGAFIVDPVNDFVQDLSSRANEAFLCLIPPNSLRVFQEVGGNVLIDIVDTIVLDI